MTADLAAWLLAVGGPIAEDERVAHQALTQARRAGDELDGDPYANNADSSGDAIVAYPPARVLAECAAKRAIVEAYQRGVRVMPLNLPGVDWQAPHIREQVGRNGGLAHAVRLLALPYTGRPGWRDKWQMR